MVGTSPSTPVDVATDIATDQTVAKILATWKNPYLLGTGAIATIAVLSLLFSLLVVWRQLHHIHHCSLFLVEMAVGALTTEAIVHLLPSLIKTDNPDKHPSGMPSYFPKLAAITAGVCVLHALDTASVVFFGRRQSSSHAVEFREEIRNSSCERPTDDIESASPVDVGADRGGNVQGSVGADRGSVGANRENVGADRGNNVREDRLNVGEGLADRTDVGAEVGSLVDVESNVSESRRVSLTLDNNEECSSGSSVVFEEDIEENQPAGNDKNLKEALSHPKLCLQPGPYRLCSIMSAGSILHSFADGVAIGAAFVKGWEAGLHLSLSVCMHEIAHKVADFAVLTASGFSLEAMIKLNVFYWASAFVGLFLSVPLSQESDDLRAWIMTIATSVFVYISLVTMSSMVRKNYLRKHIPALLIGNLGMTTGFLVIMLASLLEFYL